MFIEQVFYIEPLFKLTAFSIATESSSYLHKQKRMEQNRNNLKDGKETEEISNLDDFDIRYNKIQHQFKNTECGVYSINFII